MSPPRFGDNDVQNPPAAFSNNSDPRPHFFFHTLNWFASFHICCCMSWHGKNSTVHSKGPALISFFLFQKGLASSPETRSVWPTRRGTCTSRSPLASGPTPTVTTVTRSKDRKPCSTCDHSPPSALGPELSPASTCSGTWQPQVSRPCTPLGSDAPSELIPQTDCVLWGSTLKNWCQTLKTCLFIPRAITVYNRWLIP